MPIRYTRKNRIEESDCRRVAEKLGLDPSDVRKVVNSFFSVIVRESQRLPFDNPRKIFSRDSFAKYVSVHNIPFIGRIGPIYSRYLKWRGNEAGNYQMASRSSYRSKVLQGEIEDIAADILAGRTPSKPEKVKNSELFDRVWLVSKEGKKSARQVIPKNSKDV